MANRVSKEKSPYLMQHGENPVDWYPWCEEAFQKAQQEDKPVFLSIGYSTCHWCHVMAHESFEDQEVAEILNREYVCIKVDREERPDIDAVYMAVCQAVIGSGESSWMQALAAWCRDPLAQSDYPFTATLEAVDLEKLPNGDYEYTAILAVEHELQTGGGDDA